MSTTDDTTTRPTVAQTVHAASCTPWQLARMAGVSDPDSLTSPGAGWLRARVTDALEIIATDAGRTAAEGFDTGEWDADDITAAADAAVPVATFAKWQVFTDLAAWQVDIEEWGEITDLDEGSSLVLYVTAETLVAALLSDLDDVSDEDSDDEDSDDEDSDDEDSDDEDSDGVSDPASAERARFGTLHVTCDTPDCPCDGGPWHSDVRAP